MTRGGDVTAVLAGIDAAIRAGLTPLKLNVVVLAGENESDVPALVDAFAHLADRVVVRFIEKMPFRDEPYQAVPSRVLRERLAERYTLDPIDRRSGGGRRRTGGSARPGRRSASSAR
jgi:cyclic pyranopterin phosphate synthase